MKAKKHLLKKLKTIKNLDIETDVPLKKLTSMKVGGPVDIYLIPHNLETLKKVLNLINEIDIPLQVMGKGSNIIVSDSGFKGVILHLVKLDRVQITDNIITAESGITLSTLANKALENSLTGLEFASGIPGSLGGALCMNAGAYGDEMKDVVLESLIIDYSGNEYHLSKKDLKLSYRHSILQDEPLISVKVKLKLKPGNKTDIKKLMKKLNQKRKEKQPLKWPSAGSAFKRPPGNYAGALIEKAGMKGTKVGGAQVSKKHAGFIINRGQATAQDVKNLILKVQNEVYQNSGITLEPEPKFIGDF